MPASPPCSPVSSGASSGAFSTGDPGYRSLIVRLWLAPGGAEPLRHCEVEEIQSGEIVEPASLDEIFRLIGQVVQQEGGGHGA